MNFDQLIQNVPDYKVFLTVDEMDANSKKLAEEFPDICSIREMGKSRQGHPIYCLKIGNGTKKAFMFGCPHPNEPMGAMMLEYFSRELCENDALREEFDYTWYLIKSIDVDGTKRNEKWFKGPFTLYNYARNYFRPIGYEQAEWTFPIEYKKYKWDKPIPETKVLMDIIDEVKPDFLYSLHNAGFGGAYWYITGPADELYDKFHNAAEKQNVPLHLGEPEAAYVQQYAPAVYQMIGLEAEYDYDEQYGSGKPWETMYCGTSSDGYAKKYGTYCLVAELPYFYSDKIKNNDTLPFTRLEAVEKGAKMGLDIAEKMNGYMQQFVDLCGDDNPYIKLVRKGIEDRELYYKQDVNFARGNAEYQQPCTVAQQFDNFDITKFYKMLSWGSLIRACEFERDKREEGAEKEKLSTLIEQMEGELKTLSAEVEELTQYSVVPIQKLVRVQLESGMVVADYIKNKK